MDRRKSVLLQLLVRQFVSTNAKKDHLMNKKFIVSTLIVAFAATSGSSFAQDRNFRNDRGSQQQDHQGMGGRGENQRDNERGNSYGHGRSNDRDPHAGNRGAGPRHDLQKGARLPSEYRNRQYVVDDWRGHRLSAPPRGYHWVQTGGDYVLAAVATGLIAQILLGN
jgi:Ni/Co efflux regulator RcnB